MEDTTFQTKLTTLLRKHNMSAAELAVQIKTPASTLSRYMTGSRKPEVFMAIKVARFFNVSLDYLFGLEEVQMPPTPLSDEAMLLALSYNRLNEQAQKYLWCIVGDYLTPDEKKTMPVL